jgi:hypothetical protein
MRRFCQVIHARQDLQSRELIGLHGGFHARKELAEQLERSQIGDAGLVVLPFLLPILPAADAGRNRVHLFQLQPE